jgi:hypothetical protein
VVGGESPWEIAQHIDLEDFQCFVVVKIGDRHRIQPAPGNSIKGEGNCCIATAIGGIEPPGITCDLDAKFSVTGRDVRNSTGVNDLAITQQLNGSNDHVDLTSRARLKSKRRAFASGRISSVRPRPSVRFPRRSPARL